MPRPRVREQLLLAARALLQDRDAKALTTRAVAARAGVTEASLFNNFGSKAELLLAVVLEATPEYPAFLQALATPARPLEDWFGEVFRRARAYYMAVLPLTGAQLLGPAAPSSNARNEASYAAHRALSASLRRLHANGLLPRLADAECSALLFLGAAMHTALTELAQGSMAIEEDEFVLGKRLAASLGLLPLRPCENVAR